MLFRSTLCSVGLLSLIGRSVQSTLRYSDSNVLFAGEPGMIHVLHGGNGANSTIIFDYGHIVEGFPRFEIVSAQGDTSHFEMTYGESKAALSNYMVCSLLEFTSRSFAEV
jgi:hypothetical protein